MHCLQLCTEANVCVCVCVSVCVYLIMLHCEHQMYTHKDSKTCFFSSYVEK